MALKNRVEVQSVCSEYVITVGETSIQNAYLQKHILNTAESIFQEIVRYRMPVFYSIIIQYIQRDRREEREERRERER